MIDRTGNTMDTVFNSAVRRLVFVVLTLTGAVVIALALAACSQNAPPITPAAQGGSTSIAQGGSTSAARGSSTSAARGSSTSAASGGTPTARGSASAVIRPLGGSGTSTACPTQGVGGDSLPPLCAPPPPSSPTPITLPATTPASTPAAVAAPSVTSVSPGQGSEAGGDSVTINGTGFCADPQVSFGGVAAQATDESATQIVATTPPGPPGQPTVDITVSCNGNISPAVAADEFTYLPATTSATPTAPAASS